MAILVVMVYIWLIVGIDLVKIVVNSNSEDGEGDRVNNRYYHNDEADR